MDVIKFILVFIGNRCGICGEVQNDPVLVCGSPHNGGLVSGSCILRRPQSQKPDAYTQTTALLPVCKQIYGGAKKGQSPAEQRRTDG